MQESRYDLLDFEQKFAKMIIDLRNLRPFYSAIYESLERVDKSDSCATMGVNTTQIVYNKEFVNNMSYYEFKFVNLHEICHIALMHVSRIRNRNPKIWNLAADLYVNKLLATEFKLSPGCCNRTYSITMPLHVVYIPDVDIDSQSVEDIYNILLDNMNDDNSKTSYSNKEIDLDNIQYDIIDTGEDILKQENDNKRILSEATTKYEMNGYSNDGHCELTKRAYEIIKSHIDWRKWLTKYCIKATSKDTSFNTPDKRMYYQDAIYPGQLINDSNAIKNIKICIDTSGSISDDDLKYIFGHVHKLTKQYKIDAEVIAWDTQAVVCGRIDNKNNYCDVSNISLYGGGGTNPSCIFDYFDSKQCKEKPLVTLIFTDGFFNFKPVDKWKKKYKNTLWVITKNGDKNFKSELGIKTKVKYD